MLIWNKTAAELDDMDAVTDDATVVSDGDSSIVTAFTDESHNYQLDLVHVGRTLDYYHWDDGIFPLDQRNEIVSEVIGEVFHLKNSVAKHRPNDRAYREDNVAVGLVRVREGCGVSPGVVAVNRDIC